MPKTEEEIKAEADQKIVDDKATEDKKTADDKAAEDAKGTTYDVVVNGETKAMTIEELKTHASKAAGADSKFEQASKMRSEAEKGTRLLALAEELQKENPSEGTVKEFLQGVGVKDADVTNIMEKISGGKKKTSPDDKTETKISVDQLPKEVTEILEAAKTANFDKIREDIYKDVKKALDNDEILGKMIGELPEEDRGKVKDVLYDMAKKDVQRRILGNEPFGPEMVTSTVQGIRSLTKTLGMPATTGTQVPVVGYGPSTDLTPEIVANKPIERVSSTEPDYIEKITAKYLQQQHRGLAEEARKRK